MSSSLACLAPGEQAVLELNSNRDSTKLNTQSNKEDIHVMSLANNALSRY